jgi:ribosomal protein L33
MEHIKSHLLNKGKPDRATERGELMKFFCDRLNPGRVRDGYPALSLGRMGRILQAIPTKDLYYLKSVCEQAKDFSKKFWWEINPKKHTEAVSVKKYDKK